MRILSLTVALAIGLLAGVTNLRAGDKPQIKQDPKALAAAEKLKGVLEKRLIGKTSRAWSCSCGKCGAGPSKVIGITMPTTYRDQLALFTLWTCEMQDDHGKKWSQGLDAYMKWPELFVLFRTTFEECDVPVHHPFVLYEPLGDNFVPSGKLVSVRENAPVYIRPIADVSKSPWAAACLRLDTHVQGYRASDAVIGCEINPLHKYYGRSGSHIRHHTPDAANKSGFFVSIPAGAKHLELPLARLVRVEAGTAVFELHKGVEVFIP